MKTYIVTFRKNDEMHVAIINTTDAELKSTIESTIQGGYVVQELDTKTKGIVFYE